MKYKKFIGKTMNQLQTNYLEAECPFCDKKQNVEFVGTASKHECTNGRCEARFIIESDMTFTAGLSHLGISGIEKGVLRRTS